MPPGLNLRDWGGEGFPLLLTHGMAGNAHWWDGVAPLLCDDFRPVALDFNGHGDSGWTEDGVYGPELFVENIETARQMLGWEKMALASHSMGARIALEYARRHPERVTSLVAVDFLSGSFDSKTSRFQRIMKRRQPVYSSAELMMERFRLEPDASLLTPEQLREFARNCVKKVEKGFSWKFDWRAFIFQAGESWDSLAQIKTPTLVVRGEHSTVMTRPEYDRVLKTIPGALGVDVKGAHHHVPLDAPQELAEAMLKHLK